MLIRLRKDQVPVQSPPFVLGTWEQKEMSEKNKAQSTSAIQQEKRYSGDLAGARGPLPWTRLCPKPCLSSSPAASGSGPVFVTQHSLGSIGSPTEGQKPKEPFLL